jgi:hypothetical protein
MLAAEVERRKEERRVRCVAFCMGQHDRLGHASWSRGLDQEVAHMILALV